MTHWTQCGLLAIKLRRTIQEVQLRLQMKKWKTKIIINNNNTLQTGGHLNKGPFSYWQTENKLEQALTTTTTTTTTTTKFIPKNLLTNYQPHNVIPTIKLDDTIESNPTQSNNSSYKSVQHMFSYNATETREIFRCKKLKRQKHKKKIKK